MTVPRRAGEQILSTLIGRLAIGTLLAGQLAYGQGDQILKGRVVMEDGSPPPKPAQIERVCGGRSPVHVASTNAKGEFNWYEPIVSWTWDNCTWHAVLPGYESSVIDMEGIQKSANLGDVVLRHAGERVPDAAATRWNRAVQALKAERWTDAETDLRALTTQFPESGPIWTQFGYALGRQDKPAEARQAYQRSIQAAPWYVPAYHNLAVLDLNAEDFASAAKTVAAGLKKGASAQLYLDDAEIRYKQHDPGAEHAALQAIALDVKRELPRAEYVLGLILAGGEDKAGAAAHLRRFIEIAPNAAEAQSARARLRAFQSPGQEVAEERIAPSTPSADPSLEPDEQGEVGVPGGIAALGRAARLSRTPAAKDFFLEYCRTIVSESMNPGRSDVSDFTQTVEAYLAAVLDLTHEAEGKALTESGEKGQLILSTDTVANYAATSDVMRLFGWRPSPKGIEGFEPSELAADSARQSLPTALGIDETEMFRSLAGHGAFRIELRSDRAPVTEAMPLRSYAGKLPPGGFAEVFLRSPQLATAYVGLASMNSGAAEALVASVGVRTLVTRYAEPLFAFGEAFAAESGHVLVPGGAAAEPAWQRLAGANPADPKAFFRALLDKDQGRLAAFYQAVWRGDEAHRRYFTREGAIDRFYNWYRNSPELRGERIALARPGWRQRLFRDLPLDDAGKLYFPGGRAAWIDPARPEDEALLAAPALEALAPVAALERARKAPLDAESAKLLAAHYASWRALFPYFEELPALGAGEFQALAAFEKSASGRPASAQNALMGEWNALVKLIELGTRAGSLDAAAGARAFRAVCVSLAAQDHAAGALAALRSFAPGAGDLEEAVKTGLLRLNDQRREAYRQVRKTLDAPLLSAQELTGDAVLPALTGAVYAALLDPNTLLVVEDPKCLARHRYTLTPGGQGIFAPTLLVVQNREPGTYFAGGFETFEEAAKGLARAGAPRAEDGTEGPSADAATERPAAPGAPATAAPSAAERLPVFRANSRLVEVSATVLDSVGHYVDDLKKDDFKVVDAGVTVPVGAFENHTSGVSVALLLDTTGSMASTLPALRSSAMRLIEDLRPADSVAVYSFNSRVTELQPFTSNRDLAKRAILRTHAAGSTGLYDALIRVAHDLSGRSGKKAIVVFTDGDDNASALTADIAINRAKRQGVPIYTIAQGSVLVDASTGELSSMAFITGGLSFAIRRPEDIHGVFEHISRDLQHGYLLAFQPPPDQAHKWRPLKVSLPNIENRIVRARQGYYPE